MAAEPSLVLRPPTVGLRRILLRFLIENQCDHCAGYTTRKWDLALRMAAAFGEMFMFPPAPPVCVCRVHADDWSADQIERLLFEVLAAVDQRSVSFDALVADVTGRVA